MEQYKPIEEAIAEMREKYENPVVVEQFSNPHTVHGEKGLSSIFKSQLIICIIIIAAVFLCKYFFSDIFAVIDEIVKNYIMAVTAI